MKTYKSIPKEIDLNPGEDYTFLLNIAISTVKKLANNSWTDYNEHDPGITILEQLAYALTEVGFKANLPIENLICNTDGTIDSNKNFLFTAANILTTSPITFNDYRKILIDRFPAINNAWVSLSKDGGYSVKVAMKAIINDDKKNEFVSYLHHELNQYRNLGEEFTDIKILNPCIIGIKGKIQVQNSVDIEDICENILLHLNELLVPVVPANTVQKLLSAGEVTEDIFSGPQAKQGYILEKDLGTPISVVRINDVLRCIMAISGVDDVNELALIKTNVKTTPNDKGLPTTILIDADDIVMFDVNYTIENLTFFNNKFQLYPPAKQVKASYYNKKHKDKSPYVTNVSTDMLDIQINKGRYFNIGEYYSLKNQFPYIYGLDKQYSPKTVSVERRAQISQLKGYLAIFEQHIANSLKQLEETYSLFNLSSTQTLYFVQSIANYVGMKDLLDHEYLDNLQASLNLPEKNITRLNLFLNHILARFAEEIIPANGKKNHSLAKSTQLDAVFKSELDLLQDLPKYTSTKAKASVYEIQDTKIVQKEINGIELKLQHLLGLTDSSKNIQKKTLFIVEHGLLKNATKTGDIPDDFYYRTVSIVIITKKYFSKNYKNYLCEVISRACPAHLLSNIVFFEREETQASDTFKKLFTDWVINYNKREKSVDKNIDEAKSQLALFIYNILKTSQANE